MLSPLDQLIPVSTLQLLAVANGVLRSIDGHWSIVSAAHDVLSQRVEAMVDMVTCDSELLSSKSIVICLANDLLFGRVRKIMLQMTKALISIAFF